MGNQSNKIPKNYNCVIKEKNVLPCLVKYELNGKYSTYSACFNPVKINKLFYRKVESSDVNDYKNDISSNSNDIFDSSISLDLIIYHSDSEAKFRKEITKEYKTNSSFIIGKYILYSLSMRVDDVSFTPYWAKKIGQIAKNKSDSNEKAQELDEIFKEVGYFIPLQVHFGGKFVFNAENLKSETKDQIIAYLKSKLDLKKKANKIEEKKETKILNGKIDLNYETQKIFNQLFSIKTRNIIGGNIKSETFEEWINSLNMNNAEIIEFKNFVNIKNLVNESKLKIPLQLIDEKYEKRKKYFDTISNLKDLYYTPNKRNFSGEETIAKGICEEQDNLIYCEKYEVKGDGKAFSCIERKVNYSYNALIVGWKIIDLWNDGTNGTWTLEEDPLLKSKINCSFESQIFRGMRFNVEVYLIKYPD